MKRFPYLLLEDIAIADACFELTGDTLEEIFLSGFYALMETSVEMSSLNSSIQKVISLSELSLERLLFNFLEELIFLKDAEYLLFKECEISINKSSSDSKFVLNAVLKGQEVTDSVKTITDVKAITYYQLFVRKMENGWKARVTFDL